MDSRRDRLNAKRPMLGDMRSPFSLARSERVPDGDHGFDHNLTPYYQGFGRVSWEPMTVTDGEDTSETSLTITVRTPPETILTSDILALDGQMYRVKTIRRVDDEGRFQDILCSHYGAAKKVIYDNTATPEPAGEERPADAANPLWMPGDKE